MLYKAEKNPKKFYLKIKIYNNFFNKKVKKKMMHRKQNKTQANQILNQNKIAAKMSQKFSSLILGSRQYTASSMKK